MTKEAAMKKQFGMLLILILFLACTGCAGNGSSLLPMGAGSEPTTFCHVVSPPNPLLMGGWQIVYVRTTETGESDANPVKYWLVKHGDRYALYFDRITRGGKKRFMGWKDWTIYGDEISSDTGVRIFVENGAVYYSWQGQAPGRMNRIEK
jgi:hypothetical protein